MTKYIFLTGGVVSSLGKGIILSSIGALLNKHRIQMIKIDPYLNPDPGTMNPYEHGEVYVTSQGDETDLDLGNYERFTGLTTCKNYTSGKILTTVIRREREGNYLGKTVQIVPHLTDHIKEVIREQHDGKPYDFVLVEVGGTVGDIEGLWFLEAIRQMVREEPENCLTIHLSLVPYIRACGELKTKPTQHSVATLMTKGLFPDIIICRSEMPLDQQIKDKIAFFCQVNPSAVFQAVDLDCVYKMPMVLHDQGFLSCLSDKLKQPIIQPDMKDWVELERAIIRSNSNKIQCKLAIAGKYTSNLDSYKSLVESLKIAGYHQAIRVGIEYIDTRKPVDMGSLKHLHGIIVAGGFGTDGIESKIEIIRYCRTQQVPFLGICLGFQLAAIEHCRWLNPTMNIGSGEWGEGKNDMLPLIKIMNPDCAVMGGTMRLGDKTVNVKPGTHAHDIYHSSRIHERHRHRYDLDINLFNELTRDKGILVEEELYVSGTGDCNLPEILELSGHPFFMGVQYHPEYKTTVTHPHPLFSRFIQTAAFDLSKYSPLC